MKIFKTNLGLGYAEEATLLEIPEGYLCINEDEKCKFDKTYIIGELVDISDFNFGSIEEVSELKKQYILQESPLYGTFLFNKLLKKIK